MNAGRIEVFETGDGQTWAFFTDEPPEEDDVTTTVTIRADGTFMIEQDETS